MYSELIKNGQWSYTDVDEADFEHLMEILANKKKKKYKKVLSLDGKEVIHG
ncbi:hypothetical protein ACWOAH_10510 [Vagococcus vulneris]|uniref:hypothetical protein n=1 Tax=Vagococcus vulneris TaxID=1977869 RepID=UPI00140292AF|nr:hypothetical protein [Vagococcus vulneris]